MYYTYILRCEDNSLYTGITNNLENRMKEHFTQDEKCAKYTKSRKAIKLESVWESENKSTASKLEYAIKKKLIKKQKEEIINDNVFFYKYLEKDIEINDYKRIETFIRKDN